MSALYRIDDIRKIEQAAAASLPPGSLMQKAGSLAADEAAELLRQAGNPEVLVLAGPGNNGGDALTAAERLASKGIAVTTLLYASPEKQSPEANAALRRAAAAGVSIVDNNRLDRLTQKRWGLTIDGLFGIGLKRSPSGEIRAAIEALNRLSCAVLAIDVPSGLDADTGALAGEEGIAVRATRTATFLGDKPGLHTCHGRDYAGEVRVHTLAVDRALFPETALSLNEPALFAPRLPARRHNTHKGSYGDLAVVGGADGMAGAVILAARAAAKCGAGRVFAAFESQPPAFDHGAPELMCRAAANIDFKAAATVLGPGLGVSAAAGERVAACLAARSPLVLDADALNLVSSSAPLRRQLAEHGSSILTPHPLEAARLLEVSVSSIQSNRIEAARELARRFNTVAVLKGSGTLIARPDGDAAINPTGNPGLATAGTGDVLAGVCGALLAQHVPAWEAALAAVWLHGHAADMLAAEDIGPIGLTAGELVPAIRKALNRLVQG